MTGTTQSVRPPEDDSRPGRLEERIRALEIELKETRDRLARLNAFVVRSNERLRRQAARASSLNQVTARQVAGIFESRIWQTFVTAGGVLLRLGRLLRATPAAPPPPASPAEPGDQRYSTWMDTVEQEDAACSNLVFSLLRRRPKVSVLMPVFNPAIRDLDRAIRSVLHQTYPEWELCIADDGSCEEVRRTLERYAAGHPGICLTLRTGRGGISEASNSALASATGDLVALLDHDDELAPDALLYAVEAYENYPDAPFVYSDEDKINAEGGRYDPFFKPDWSPDLLLSENYVGHLLVTRRDHALKAGGFRPMCDGSQDYDLVLRLSQLPGTPVHIAKVLYHWRAVPGSAAADPNAKEYAHTAARRALEDHLRKTAPEARVEAGIHAGRWRVRYPIPPSLDVSIVIASGGKVDILRNNLESLFEKTDFPRFEVVIADNSRSAEVKRVVEEFARRGIAVRWIDWRNKPFNYSVINNHAARQCKSSVLLFLNDDTTVIARDWLTAMMELIARPEVGAVGAKLLYPNGVIQHGGVIMGLYGNCGHAFKGLDGSRPHYFDLSDVIRNVSAVTGACLMTRAEIFREVGGFDERLFAVAFNDIDLCLKIGARGYRVLYTPHALLYHHEAFSKTQDDLVPHPAEVAAMQRKWSAVIEADPFYNPNLTRATEDFAIDA